MKEIDWANLSFGYMKTDYNVRCYYRDGKWGEIEVCSEETLNIHMAATCLHYGQEAFEGLKAYRCPDGKVRVFRMDENAKRLQSTCRGILMPELPTERFEEMVKKVVRLNERFIPPYESGAAAYRYGSPSGRASGQRIPLRDFRHAGRAVLQGRLCHQSVRDYPRVRPFRTVGNGYL